MEIKKDSIVVSIRTKFGENLLGFYAGESISKLEEKPSILLYRPIAVNYVEYQYQGKQFQNYSHTLYFPFGGPLVEILQSDIRNSEVASDFFTFWYTKVLGEEIVNEELLQNRIISFYEEIDVRNVMQESDSDSIFVKTISEYIQ